MIDWSKAPEATHYDARPGCEPAFMRKNHNGRDWEFLGADGHWIMYGRICDSQLAGLIKRPKPWTGEGMPPVGTVCEFNGFNPDETLPDDPKVGDKVTIVAHFKSGDIELAAFTFQPAVDWECAQIAQGAQGCFRPIRAPEQIVAEEREKALAEMAKVIGFMGDGPYTTMSPREAIEALYDANYRKLVAP